MAPKAITKRAKASKLAKVLAARIKAANIKISNSNTRVEPKQSGKGKSGKKRKAGDSTLNEASSRKRPSREESSQPRDDEEHDEALEAEIMHNLTGGLKLLKRETVTMGWLTSSIIRGKKIYVKFSKAGDPCDKDFQKHVPHGSHDVLTEALGNPEHRGRVRGIGAVKPEAFFNIPQGKRGRKKKCEEFKDLISKEREKWEEEMTKKHDEDMRRMQEKYEDQLKQSEAKLGQKFSELLESKLEVMRSSGPFNERSPTPTGPMFGFAKSGEGSCNHEEAPILGKYEAVKKKLVLQTEHDIIGLATTKGTKSGQMHLSLCLESIDNIVAYGKAISSEVDLDIQTIHGTKLGRDKIRVEILVVVDGDAKLPFPIKDEMHLVKEALGSVVAWPRHMCVLEGINDSGQLVEPITIEEDLEKSGSKCQKKQFVEVNLENLPTNLPFPLLNLCKWSNEALQNGIPLKVKFCPEVFGHESNGSIYRTDVYAMAHLDEICGAIVMSYMSHLFGVLKTKKLHDLIMFVDPNDTFAIGNQKTPTDRSSGLMERFKMGKQGSIFLIPYNTGKHWTLSVVDIDNKMAYWFDPLRPRLPATNEWTDVVNNAVKFYHAQKAPKKKVMITVKWTALLGIPKQWNDKTCGYFILRYMRDIVSGKGLPALNKWFKRSGLVYTQPEIDEVRSELAEEITFLKLDL
ncbi:hypothetical protein M5689_021377 [Euphorbia peplus]|nr:hypothetical protein M5689_021377 [Euphorbia peplus]